MTKLYHPTDFIVPDQAHMIPLMWLPNHHKCHISTHLVAYSHRHTNGRAEAGTFAMCSGIARLKHFKAILFHFQKTIN